MVKAQKFVLAKKFEGQIKDGDLQLVEEELPPIEDDEFLVESLYLSVDPYQRIYVNTFEIGQLMIGYQVAKIIESKNRLYPVGQIVAGDLGWRTHTIIKKDDKRHFYAFPDIGDLSPSLGVGILGMPGSTVYFGFWELCKPKKGEIVVVSGAGGAVGNHVGQLAKLAGCTVIGITGSDTKAHWLKTIGFDHVINYKTSSNIAEDLRAAAPEGVDIYFDNVGGETSSIVILQMKSLGRVSVCGSIVCYNESTLPKATILQPAIVTKQLTVTGFIIWDYIPRWSEAIKQNLEWIQTGKLKVKETITEGFENTPQALAGVLKGENIGKAVVRVKASSVESDSINFGNALKTFKNLANKQ